MPFVLTILIGLSAGPPVAISANWFDSLAACEALRSRFETQSEGMKLFSVAPLYVIHTGRDFDEAVSRVATVRSLCLPMDEVAGAGG